MKHLWLSFQRVDLQTERLQAEQEGRDLAGLIQEFARLDIPELDDPVEYPGRQQEFRRLLDRVASRPFREGFAEREPDDLSEIRDLRPGAPPLPPLPGDPEVLADRVHGAWLGRVCGCLLGKPVEGWRRPRMWGYLRETGRFPLDGYFQATATPEVRERYGVGEDRCFLETVTCMPEDDDTNYTVLNLALLEQHGPGFTSEQVAEFWLSRLPVLHTCTAERVAYRNLVLQLPPPLSATHQNPYREWIGAQIRADLWGYFAAGDPELAAELAWRDARVSHVRNGIYGAMWAAAMIAAAFTGAAPETCIRAGLGQIPAECRLAVGLREVLAWREQGATYDQAVERLHGRWSEERAHDWCHAIPNALAVAVGLLWGERGFGPTLCRAVQACFDTDCNGATAGSVIGALTGAGSVPAEWSGPIRDTLETGVAGFHRVRVSDLAARTAALVARRLRDER